MVTFPAAEHNHPWLVPNYTAWSQRHTGISSLPKATTQWCPARTWTCDLWIVSPMPYRQCHQATHCSDNLRLNALSDKKPASMNKYTYKQVHLLSGLAYNPTCRSPLPQIVYNTGRHRASDGLFLTPHIVHGCPASLWHRANNRQMCYQFFNFWPWGAYPWAKVHQKERTY